MTFEWVPIQLPYKACVQDPHAVGIIGDSATITIHRGTDLRLATEIDGFGSLTEDEEPVPGTEVEHRTVALVTKGGTSTLLDGYATLHQTTTHTRDGHPTVLLRGTAESLSMECYGGTPSRICEWLTNLPDRLWCETTKREDSHTARRTRGDRTIDGERSGRSHDSTDHVRVEVGLPTLEFFEIGTVPRDLILDAATLESPGFIEYKGGPEGLPDKKLRCHVRRAMEFAFGCGLGVLGWSELDEQGRTCRAAVTSAYVPGGLGHAEPPALLHDEIESAIDPHLMGSLVRAFVNLAQTYDLNRAVWLYLHARNAPLEMAAGYVGSAFEVLRRGYYERPENASRSKLLPKNFNELRKALDATIDTLGQQSEWSELQAQIADVKKKFPGLNEVSGTRLNLKFLDDLRLDYSDIERNALQARNDAAHGNSLEVPYLEILRAYRALHTLSARAFLKLLEFPGHYIDYSVEGHLAAALEARQGEMSEDGPEGR